MPTRRTSPDLKIIKGTFRRDRQSKTNASKFSKLGPPPDYFNEAQKQIWLDVEASAPPGYLVALDRSLVEGFVMTWFARQQAVRGWNATRTTLLVKAGDWHGRATRNPYLREMNRQTSLLHVLESDLGFSPRIRCDLNFAPPLPTENDPLLQYLT